MMSRRSGFILRTLLVAAGSLAAHSVYAAVCHVTPDGLDTNDGSSWASPLSINQAVGNPDCTSIWIKTGVYPGFDNGPSGLTVSALKAIYGGFLGTETSFTDRPSPVDATATILQGVREFAGGPTPRRVFTISPPGRGSSFDGFTMTNGLSGAQIINSSAAFSNVIFDDNGPYPAGGGAVTFIGNASATFTNVTFRNNVSGSVGAVSSVVGDTGGGTAIFNNVTFSGNRALNGDGGAVSITGSRRYFFNNVTFSGNTATGNGGAIANDSSNSPVFNHVLLWGNTASASPEVYNADTRTSTLNNSIIQGGCLPAAGFTCDAFTAASATSNPNLGPLQNNGGATLTMMPDGNGPAVNPGGTAAACPAGITTDQRDVTRPQGTGCDIGAVERRSLPLDVTVVGDALNTVSAAAAPAPLTGGVNSCNSNGGASCAAVYDAEAAAATVTLTATAAAGHHFVNWGGDCASAGTTPNATVTMDQARSCIANFATGPGGGTSTATAVPVPGLSGLWLGLMGLMMAGFGARGMSRSRCNHRHAAHATTL